MRLGQASGTSGKLLPRSALPPAFVIDMPIPRLAPGGAGGQARMPMPQRFEVPIKALGT